MKNYGLINAASIVPENVHIGNVKANYEEITRLVLKASEDAKKRENLNAPLNLMVFPELCLTGYTCGDLFNQTILHDEAEKYLIKLSDFIKEKGVASVIVIGAPVRKDNQLFNCAVVYGKGGLLGFIPKTFIPNYSEYYEARYFSPSTKRLSDFIELPCSMVCSDNNAPAEINMNYSGNFTQPGHKNNLKNYPFNPNLLIKDTLSEMVLGIDICEDIWAPNPPSVSHCLHSANVIANISASNETIGKTKYREDLIKMQTAACACGYIYTSAGKDESTSDTVFSGHTIAACNGNLIKSKNGLKGREEIIYAQIDLEKCINDRIRINSFMGMADNKDYTIINTETFSCADAGDMIIEAPPLTPFVPKEINERADEILKIQANGLAQKLKKTGLKKAVVGISGGLDSALALIVAMEAFSILNLDKKGIIGITMPAFGTTDRTRNNSLSLMEKSGITFYEIDIKKMCDEMYKGLNHDKNLLDITFENVQARTRTEILMNMANREGGLVIGTGDLSELALGWCTYNGDHMSMYGVNSSIPKTLVKYMVQFYAEFKAAKDVKKILLDICSTPISPELLPPNPDGTIAQKTEENIGSYVIHDFTLYYMMRYGFSPEKIFHLCLNSMVEDYKKRFAGENKDNGCNAVDTMENEQLADKRPSGKSDENRNFYSFDEEKIRKEFAIKIKENLKIFYKRFFSQQFKRNCMPDGIKVGSISLSPRSDWRMPSDGDGKMWLEEVENL